MLYKSAKFQVQNQKHLEEIKKRNLQWIVSNTEKPLFMQNLSFSLLPNETEFGLEILHISKTSLL